MRSTLIPVWAALLCLLPLGATAADDARVREELAQRRTERARARAERRQHRQAREAGRAALSGPGRAHCRQILADLARQGRRHVYETTWTQT